MYFKNVYRRLRSVNILFFFSAFLFAASAMAQVKVGLDFSSLQENRSSTQLSSVGRTFYDGYLNIAFKKEFPLYLTLGYLYINSVENYADSSYTKMTSTNPYVGLAYHFWSKQVASLIVGGFYSPYAKLVLSETAGNESWDGATLVTKLSASFSVSTKVKLNAGLYYISESFGDRTSGSLTTKSSLNQSYFAPSLGVAVAF